jgi:hypothetical protein
VTSRSPNVAHRLGLTFDIGEKGPIVTSLQRFRDQNAQDDLKAHRQLEHGRRPAREDASPVQDIPRDHKEDTRLLREHYPA